MCDTWEWVVRGHYTVVESEYSGDLNAYCFYPIGEDYTVLEVYPPDIVAQELLVQQIETETVDLLEWALKGYEKY